MRPRVSVIIPSYNSRATIERSLTSLLNQECDEPFEVIVVDSSRDGTAELVAQTFPSVKLVTSAERKYCGAARNIGVSKARGEIFAFTDADCIAPRFWVSNIIQAHMSECPVIGGAVGNGNPESYVGWAYYFSTLTQWMPGTPRGMMRDIPTTALTVKRWAFEIYGPFLDVNFSSDTSFNWKVIKDGQALLFEPSIMVFHINPARLRTYLKREVVRGMHFAVIRAEAEEFSLLRRIAFAAICPALPFLLYWRAARRVVEFRNYLIQFVLTSPLTFLGLVLWSFGEMIGYLRESSVEMER